MRYVTYILVFKTVLCEDLIWGLLQTLVLHKIRFHVSYASFSPAIAIVCYNYCASDSVVCIQVIFFFLWRYSPHLGLGPPPWNSPFHFGFLDLRHSVGLLGRVISSSQGLYLYKKHRKTYTKHPCPEWDSNPRSRLPSERRQCMLGYRDRRYI
jgi:hypothetical protein